MPKAPSLKSQACIILALETSQREASVALRDRSGTIHEEALSPRKRHDDDLLPAIDRLFARANLTSKDLRGPPSGTVCVSIGPGGFTGLRIAVATAKMFSEVLGVKLVAVPSALVAAWGADLEAVGTEVSGQKSEVGGEALNVLVALACKGESFWATRVGRSEGRETARVGWRIVGEPGIVNIDAFDATDIHAVIADEFFPDAARARIIAANIPILPLTLSARGVLMIGEAMLARGEMVDPLRMLPLYPRQPEAVTLWDARVGAKG